jgi:hypothetical protein
MFLMRARRLQLPNPVKTLYVYSEVFDLKPTSPLSSGCLKNSAHLFNFLT